jgi:hypothetical protein
MHDDRPVTLTSFSGCERMAMDESTHVYITSPDFRQNRRTLVAGVFWSVFTHKYV